MPNLTRKSSSVLDVGCAAGGFSSIFRYYNPTIEYVGVDVVHSLLRNANARYPEGWWVRSDGVDLPFRNGQFDLVWSSGIMHLNSSYRTMLERAWRASQHWMACDFRVSLEGGSTTVGSFHIDFGGSEEQSSPLPYFVLSEDELMGLINELEPSPGRVTLQGYPAAVSPMAQDTPKEVLMVFVVLEHGPLVSGTTEVIRDIRSREQFEKAVR